MIPKVVHYFWFSDDPYPQTIQKCLDSWQAVLTDYEFKKWDLSNCIIDCEFAARALEEKKWAFLTDYFRFKVIHEHGGIYLDTDVFIIKPFGDLLKCQSFWASDIHGNVEPIAFGSIKGNGFVEKIIIHFRNIQVYENEYSFIALPHVIKSFFNELDKSIFNAENKIIQGKDLILSYDYFCPLPFEQADDKDFIKYKTNKTIGIHLWNANWFDPFRFFWNKRYIKGWKAVFNELFKNPKQDRQFYKDIFYHFKCQLFGYPKS